MIYKTTPCLISALIAFSMPAYPADNNDSSGAQQYLNLTKKLIDQTDNAHNLNKGFTVIKIGVFGQDDRYPVPPVKIDYFNFIQPISNITVTNQNTNNYEDVNSATGFVTGENCDVLISVAHVLFEGKKLNKYINSRRKNRAILGKRKKRVAFHYLGNNDRFKYIFATPISTGFDLYGKIGIGEDDWAIYRLDRPAPRYCTSIPIEYDAHTCNGETALVGYHEDSWDHKLISICKSYPHNEHTFKNDCDMKVGSSGSPVFCNKDGVNTIIGISSGDSIKNYITPIKGGVSNVTYNPVSAYNIAVRFSGRLKTELIKELNLSKIRKAGI